MTSTAPSGSEPAGYAYIRHSTKRQGGDDKDSVSRQKTSIRALAKQYGLEIPDQNFYYENGVSAFSGKNRTHGKLKELIDQIDGMRIRKGDYVFVESIDRLTRQRLLQAKELVNGLLEKGIILVTTLDNQKYQKATLENGIDDLTQDILLSVISKRAWDESNTKSIRRKSAWNKAKEAAEKDLKPFNAKRPPYGIQFNELAGKFELDPVKSKEVIAVFESLKMQGVTNTIKLINQTSVHKWTSQRVKDLFITKYPIGYLYSQKKIDGQMVFDKYIENYYPQIISFQLFEEARLAMQGRKGSKSIGRVAADNSNIFRHTAVCDICNESMFFSNNSNGKAKYINLNCRNNFESTNKCSNRFRFDLAVYVLFEIVRRAEIINKLSSNYTPKPNEKSPLDDFYDEFGVIQSKGIVQPQRSDFSQNNKYVWDFLYNPQKHISQSIYLAEKFSKIMQGNSEQKKFHKENVDLLNEKAQMQQRIESLNKKVNSLVLADADIPDVIVMQLVNAKKRITAIDEEIAQLTVQQATKATVKIETLSEFESLFKTDEGRLKIITFLNSSGLSFNFNYDKKSRILTTTLYQEFDPLEEPEPINHIWTDRKFKRAYRHRDKMRLREIVHRKELTTVETYYETNFAPMRPYGYENLGEFLMNQK
ncbi:TPA: recombinase family protein [Pseudomonas aeruginosa]|uniref:recombinase family protein n=1 Tax=Pseudomonas aeruginosa TaxID=287 RepID=UPI001068034C|nr:recombinase family protein [Pseudomonas aeruginosa]TEP98086.1 recombinase family protein [Pseudomonas aeruginosa]HEQ0067067.1 recombinase family protein [Pseudomonas aeruginosa]